MNSIINMPEDARVWVYQSSRILNDKEILEITDQGKAFIANWDAHGASLRASLEVLHNRFIVISVDEKQALASGCSIDKSVRFIKEIDLKYNLNLFDRLQVAYRTESEILSCSYSQFEKLAEQGVVNETTIVFNNMVSSKLSFDKEWEVPLKQSWQNRVFA